MRTSQSITARSKRFTMLPPAHHLHPQRDTSNGRHEWGPYRGSTAKQRSTHHQASQIAYRYNAHRPASYPERSRADLMDDARERYGEDRPADRVHIPADWSAQR